MKPGFATADPAAALARFLTTALDARSASVTRLAKLGGGAIPENWAVDATVNGGARSGALALVLRTDATQRATAWRALFAHADARVAESNPRARDSG